MTDRNELGKILKQRRLMIPMTLEELSAATAVSASHLGRIERGDRFPSARVLRKIAQPLGFGEGELLTLADYLSPQPSDEMPSTARLDPYVAALLSQEPVEMQRAVVTILSVLKAMAKGSGSNISFAEYVHRNYPQVDEDIITMVKDIMEHPPGGQTNDR